MSAWPVDLKQKVCVSQLWWVAGFSCALSRTWKKCTTSRGGPHSPASMWIPGTQIEVLSPKIKVLSVLFLCNSFLPFVDDWFMKVSCSEGSGNWEEGARRPVVREGGGLLPKTWVERSGSSGTLLGGNLKVSLAWKGPHILLSSTLYFSCFVDRGREQNLQPISHCRGKFVIWLSREVPSCVCSSSLPCARIWHLKV